jgi:transposase
VEWLPEDHLVWTILAAVDTMDLRRFREAYRLGAAGRPPYDPAVMVSLLLYAYARGIRSSRQIERGGWEDVAFKVITGLRTPDHSTIAEFRRRHEAGIAGLFDEVLGLCREAGLVSVGVITIDGTKIMANASMDQNRSYREIANEILRDAEEADRQEDEQFGDRRGDELPEQLHTPEGRHPRPNTLPHSRTRGCFARCSGGRPRFCLASAAGRSRSQRSVAAAATLGSQVGRGRSCCSSFTG